MVITMNKISRSLLHVVLPTALGTIVYVGWRSTDLLVFQWIEYFGLNAMVLRPNVVLPDWLLFSFPDGCWVYATTSWMLLIWGRLNQWTWVVVILAVCAEFGQLLGLVRGTYQSLDVLFYLGGFILAGAFNEQTHLVCVRDSCYGDLSPW